MAAVKVVIADDHAIWRSGLRADLGENFTVVGEAADAAEALEVIEATDPDLVLSDLHMPEGGGIALVKALAGRVPGVMLTVSEAESDLLDAIAAGERVTGPAIVESPVTTIIVEPGADCERRPSGSLIVRP